MNENKSLISISIFIVALAVFYYFALYLPKQNNLKVAQQNQQEVLKNQQQCSKDGSDYYKKYSIANYDSKYIWDTPEFHYNSNLNTCLAYIRYIQFDSFSNSQSFQYSQVADTYANKIILYGWFTRDVSTTPYTEKLMTTMDGSVPNYTSDQFYLEKGKLFSE